MHAANLAYRSSLQALDADDPQTALALVRRAQSWDPTLALYPIHEAYTLGLLANSQPDEYLSEAIAAHEEAQQLNPTWDLGWHNLAALYAQAGDYEKAVEAQATAITWNPVPAGYHLTLGIYHEALGDVSASTAAFVQALRRSPGLAASAFWTDRNHPERADIPERAAAALPDEPARALRVATTAGIMAQASDIADQIDPNTNDADNLRALGDWAIKVNDEAIVSCPPCYFQKAASLAPDTAWLDYTQLAQYALQNPTAAATYQLDSEKLARTALFMMPSAVENWYTLAQIAEDSNADPNTVDSLLLRSVKTGSPETNFAMFVYGRTARMTYLPQGLVPQRTAQQIRPWVELSTRYIASNRYDDARQLLSELVRLAPYEPEPRALIATLPE